MREKDVYPLSIIDLHNQTGYHALTGFVTLRIEQLHQTTTSTRTGTQLSKVKEMAARHRAMQGLSALKLIMRARHFT